MEPSANHPNITAGEMLRRLHEEIITNPDPDTVDQANEVFNHIFTQISSLQFDFDRSLDDITPVLKQITRRPKYNYPPNNDYPNNKVSVQQTRELAQREQHLKRAVRQDRELMEKSYGSASEFGRYLLTATVTDSDGNSHGDTITHLAERIEHRFNNLHGLHVAFPASWPLMYAAEGC